jgi:GrpB-like predicted nucleotidyltransferase (UPF0157 family)
MKKEFEILTYDPNWEELYVNEKRKLKAIFGDNLNSIHHIGSTAIRNTKAKPEIDILMVVKDDSSLSKYNQLIEELGYTVRGECLDAGGTKGRFYYSKDEDKRRTHKLHVCKIGHAEILPKLLFVKYLNDHEDEAIEYADLKTRLSKEYNYGKSIEKYLAGKTDFILNVLKLARKEYQKIDYADFR